MWVMWVGPFKIAIVAALIYELGFRPTFQEVLNLHHRQRHPMSACQIDMKTCNLPSMTALLCQHNAALRNSKLVSLLTRVSYR